ncbi:hypothetical protein L2E82_02832 [Cichorium intybus]|uniref:Uncharacterized protein n=1 Tax=Cichorium intybus TaxID=13427 RepID=A0ACB9H2R4_CICIN|nr:hypothetical protein L2E82_02832 [Cichorium intybus]
MWFVPAIHRLQSPWWLVRSTASNRHRSYAAIDLGFMNQRFKVLEREAGFLLNTQLPKLEFGIGSSSTSTVHPPSQATQTTSTTSASDADLVGHYSMCWIFLLFFHFCYWNLGLLCSNMKVIRMMTGTIRRKALSLCSSALANNGIVRSLERVEPASRGYVAGIPGFGRVPEYLKPLRDLRTEFSTPKWVRYFSSHSESTVSEPVAQFQTNKVTPGYFTASGAVVASAPIVNVPSAAKFGLGSTATSTFLPNLALFWHINNGIEEILADYVHHEMTRSLVLVLMRLFLIVAAKDVFVATN